MRILVTGGCGFIGHGVVEQLQNSGHQVRVLDNLTTYGIVPLDEHHFLQQERRKKFKDNTLVHDISIQDIYVNGVFEMFLPDIVIHLASMPRQRIVNANPVRSSRVMCEGLLNLLEQSVKHSVSKFVYVSSSMVYGDFTDGVKEDDRTHPQGLYAIMKLAGESLVKDYAHRGLIKSVVVRPSAVYGPLDIEDRVVSKFIIGAIRGDVLQVNGPDERLDFTYVDDTVSGIVGATLSENTHNKTYNITRGESVSLLEAAELSIKIAGGSGEISVRDRDLTFPSRGSLDITAATRDFDYSPTVNFADGLKRYYNWLVTSEFWQQKLKI
jgi:nucleoside-diphosphate-sugar epimerase